MYILFLRKITGSIHGLGMYPGSGYYQTLLKKKRYFIIEEIRKIFGIIERKNI